MRPSSFPRPSAPCLSPAGRSSATLSALSAASAAWPRKPASARSGHPRYCPSGAWGGGRAGDQGGWEGLSGVRREVSAAPGSRWQSGGLGDTGAPSPTPGVRPGFRVSPSVGLGDRTRDTYIGFDLRAVFCRCCFGAGEKLVVHGDVPDFTLFSL